MRQTLFSIIALLLSLTASAETITLNVGGSSVEAVVRVDTENHVAILGNGYNACIPFWSQGELVIPGWVVIQGDSCRVEVGKVAFRFCSNLTSVKIEEGVQKIDAFAFVGCSNVLDIQLPASLTTIERGAFANMKSIKSMLSAAATAPTWGWNDLFSAKGTKASLKETASQRLLYVPMGAVENYAASRYNDTIGWPDAFKRIYEYTEEPQTIESLAELDSFRLAVKHGNLYKNSTNRYVKLIADIDMSDVDWEPIGTSDHPYSGVFDGGGHTISNLRIQLGFDYIGLFGYADSATIYNMHLRNPRVFGKDYVGAVLGCATKNSHITDVLVTGQPTGDDNYYTVKSYGSGGGIVGWAEQSTIERCMFKGQVKCKGWAGGIIGNVHNGVVITDCSASNFIQNFEPVNEPASIGGIVGGAGEVRIYRCYARNVLSLNEVGILIPSMAPIVGKTNHRTYGNRIENCVYWTNYGYDLPYGTYEIVEDTHYAPATQDNRKFENQSDMYGDNTKSTLGAENWFYFDRHYVDDPVPITLKDMYIAACVDIEDANGLVYRPVGDPISAYDVVGYKGHASSLTIPDTYNDKPVTGIEENAFRDNDSLRNIVLGANLTYIGGHAFEDCDSLLAIDLPDAVDSIGEDAFVSCESLASFNIGQYFLNHANNFIAYCPNLTSLTASRGNTHNYYCEDNVLYHNAWSGPYTPATYFIACAPGKTGVYSLPTGDDNGQETYILDYAFSSCRGLTGITFPAHNGKKYILGNAVFDGADNLQYIDMSEANIKWPYAVCRGDTASPFYGLSDNTIVYMPENNITVPEGEGNAVIADDVHYIKLNDGWDFNPPVAFTAGKVSINRQLVGAETLYAKVKTDGDGNIVYTDTKFPTCDAEGNPTGDSILLPEMETETHYDPCIYPSCLPYDLTLTSNHAQVYEPASIQDVDGFPTAFMRLVPSKQMTAYHPYYIVVDGDTAVSLNREDSTAIARIPDEPYVWANNGYEFRGTTVNIPGKATSFRAYFQQVGGGDADDLQVTFHCYVRFIDPLVQTDDSLLCVETADYGAAVTPPVAPEHAGYEFSGWDSNDYENVTGHITIHAVYTPTTPTGIGSQKSIIESRKILRDGQLLIERDGKTYNAQGAEVK